jgi:hypothetical protein
MKGNVEFIPYILLAVGTTGLILNEFVFSF